MLKQLLCKLQYILPKHLISIIMGRLANSRTPWLKNNLIDLFCRSYKIRLDENVISMPHDYPTFNAFFTRELKPGARQIDQNISSFASPADGYIAAIGNIHNQQLLQAKNMYFDLTSLLGGNADIAAQFHNGNYATIYLAPHNYHRVHMPMAGSLRRAVFIPGNLFSVNRMTSDLIPNLYARNERLVLLFDTAAGPMTVIMVGALIVGSMQTVWMDQPIRCQQIEDITPPNTIYLEKGAEVGQFQMGSTVIVLMPQDSVAWSSQLTGSEAVLMGQTIGTLRQA